MSDDLQRRVEQTGSHAVLAVPLVVKDTVIEETHAPVIEKPFTAQALLSAVERVAT